MAGSKTHTTTNVAGRMGFNATYLSVNRFGCGKISPYVDLSSLKAGVYLDYVLCEQPERPHNMEYIQTIHMHQAITCASDSPQAWDRIQCPYVEPHDYLLGTSRETIVAAVKANPGSLWLLGNEIDRRDWPVWDDSVDPPQIIGTDGQGEMVPELYARAHYELYHLIKDADPTAQIANGSIIQPTPLRLRYLTRAWDAYQNLYGEPMPVDVWNVHNFILREVRGGYGADFPPGVTGTLNDGQYWQQNDRDTHMNLTIFDQQIRAMRQWLKERGQQDKPLIITEYGVLYQHDGMGNPALVESFMQGSFDYFLHTTDCGLGYRLDACRLVQRWLWFSMETQTNGLNPYGGLYATESLTMTNRGKLFRDYAESHLNELAWPLVIRTLYLPFIFAN